MGFHDWRLALGQYLGIWVRHNPEFRGCIQCGLMQTWNASKMQWENIKIVASFDIGPD